MNKLIHENGITYNCTQRSYLTTVQNIDIEPWVDTMIFKKINANGVQQRRYNNYDTVYDLAMCKKQFSNITKIIIEDGVGEIDISNFLFPNVKYVESKSQYFLSSNVLILTRYNSSSLLNTFCKKPGETIDLKDVSNIKDYAMEGCKSTDIINLKNNVISSSYYKNSCAGTLFRMNPYLYTKENGVFMLGKTIVAIDDTLETLDIPYDAVSIDSGIDFSNININKVVVKNINNFMGFSRQINCNNLIMDTDERINFHKIAGCYNQCIAASALNISEKSKYYSSIDGIIYTKNKKTLLYCPSNKKGEVIIPEGTEIIAENAFSQCDKITSIVCPDTLLEIDSSAFYQCIGLTDVVFNKKLKEIGANAFSYTHIHDIEIPDSVKLIRAGAFSYCNLLTSVTLHDGLEEIEQSAFNGCDSIDSISIPATVKRMGKCSLPDTILHVNVKENYPKDIIDSFISNDCDSGILCCLNIENYGNIYIARDISNEDLKYINSQFNIYQIDRDFTDFLYMNIRTTSYKQDTAIYVYEQTKNEDIGKYLRRAGKSILSRLIRNKKEEIIIKFLSFGFVTAKTLKDSMNKVENADMPLVSAYLLKAIEDLDESKTTFRL